MPEHRARTYHRNRVANTFSEEIGAMLEGELSDPRIAPSYVTDVVLAPGGKSARILSPSTATKKKKLLPSKASKPPAPTSALNFATAWAFAMSRSSPLPSTAPRR